MLKYNNQLTRLEVVIDGNIAIFTINSPPVNLISPAIIDQMSQACTELPEPIGALILTGAGSRSFSAGLSITEQAQNSREENQNYFIRLYHMLEMIAELPCPVISAINGYALGAGFELALSSDIRVADENSVMGAVGVNLGLVFGTQRLSRLVGPGKAKDLLFTGRRLNAHEACSLGLIEHLAPVGTALSKARKIAESIASKDPGNLRAVKKSVNQGLSLDLSQGLALELRYLLEMLETDNYHQRVQKFVQGK